MKNQLLSNTLNSKKRQEPIFHTETTEGEMQDNPTCTLDLPLFHTSKEQREVMNEAMKKAKDKEKQSK